MYQIILDDGELYKEFFFNTFIPCILRIEILVKHFDKYKNETQTYPPIKQRKTKSDVVY